MLIKFEVENFKNFKDRLTLSFVKDHDYDFNEEVISRDGKIITKSIIYGPNESGKSNLGLALFDIVTHLTDTSTLTNKYLWYSNLNNSDSTVKFCYWFEFEGHSLVYEYKKKSLKELLMEVVTIDGNVVLEYDYIMQEGRTTLKGAETLSLSGEFFLSRVKYLFNTAILEENEVNKTFRQFSKFVNGMLLFYSLDERGYQGFKNVSESIAESIISKGKIKEFEQFLRDEGLNYSLVAKNVDGQKSIYCRFKNRQVSFFSVASTGTISLTLFYYWYLRMEELSFVYIDEYDAFYHFDLALSLVGLLKKNRDCQIVLSTHNTDLLSNDLLRPDCYYEIKDGKIKSLADLTDKDIRKAHNLQKMYKAGVFNE